MKADATLIDRYVAQAVRVLPTAQRSDIEAELRDLVAEAVTDLTNSGMDAGEAERQVLTDLGPPHQLAARYTDRPLHLVGPDLFPDYLRVLRVLLATVVPLWFVFHALVAFVNGSSTVTATGSALYGALGAGMLIAFFTTVVYAAVERRSGRRAGRNRWNPADLPALPDRWSHLAEMIGGVALLALVSGVVVVLQTAGGAGGVGVGPIQPDLWSSGALWLILVFAAASLAMHQMAFYTGWSTVNAVATTALDLLFAVPVIWLVATGRLLNPDHFAGNGMDVVAAVVIGLVIVLTAGDAVDGFLRVARARRSR